MDNHVFQIARETVAAIEVAQMYNFKFDANGKKCICPFHADSHASMDFPENGKWWYCRACNAHGDAVGLVARMDGIGQYAALVKLNDAFHLNLPLGDSLPAVEAHRQACEYAESATAQERFEQWRHDFLMALFCVHRFSILEVDSWVEMTDIHAFAIQKREEIDNLIEILGGQDVDEQTKIFMDRGAREEWLCLILQNMPKQSMAS